MNYNIPTELLSRIINNVELNYEVMPFKLRGIVISKDLIKVAIQILNSEAAKSLPQNARNASIGNTPDGLDKRIKEILNKDQRTANILSDVLKEAGIVEVIKVENQISGRIVKGTRLMPEWCW